LSKLDYVVSSANIEGKSYTLDASHAKLGFGDLPLNCYNGNARIISSNPVLINLEADSLKETKITSYMFFKDDKGGLTGTYTSILGKNESYSMRERLGKTDLTSFFNEAKKGYGFDVKITNGTVDSLKHYEEPVTVKYNIAFEPTEDILYLTPLLAEATKTNPFKASKRIYPVEMPYAVNEVIVLRLDIPEGYKVEEVPKSTKVSFNENEGMFEYIISKDANMIQLRSVIKMNKANYEPEDYESLRDFFGYIVKKHAEPIVLKKVK
jgi:hypothetical protein